MSSFMNFLDLSIIWCFAGALVVGWYDFHGLL